MKNLLTLTAVIECSTSILLVTFPSILISILLDSTPNNSVALTIARHAGVALIPVGVACWAARNDNHSSTVNGLFTALIMYNAGAAVVLAYASAGFGLSGIGLWPVVLVPAAMGIWCVLNLLNKRIISL